MLHCVASAILVQSDVSARRTSQRSERLVAISSQAGPVSNPLEDSTAAESVSDEEEEPGATASPLDRAVGLPISDRMRLARLGVDWLTIT